MPIFLLALLSLSAFASSLPTNGMYRCVNGNNDSICDQKVRVTTHGQITILKVTYEGYCNGQGPYQYACDENICTDGTIRITSKDESHYYWENLGYGFYCDMEKSN